MIVYPVFVKSWLLVLTYLCLPSVHGHGALIEPAGRSSLWRFPTKYPGALPNYDDNQLFCGGRHHQWNTQNGKCGLCGDPYEGPRNNEAGGKYAKHIIAKTYQKGSSMEVKVHLTANHKGWFEFRLCKNDDFDKKFTQVCLDKHLLQELNNPSKTRFSVSTEDGTGIKTYNLQLPADLTCTQCVLQWKYNTGNSHGYDEDGKSCLGCGGQEQFYGCSDIEIVGSGLNTATPPTTSTSKPTTASPTTSRRTTTLPSTLKPTTTLVTTKDKSALLSTILKSITTAVTTPTPSTKTCKGAPLYGSRLDAWCNRNCFFDPPYCPTTHCICS